MMKKSSSSRGFTLVELLVVMAIMAVLIGISVAGLGYAMRRSRNISRQSAMANLDRALEAYYSDNQNYPLETEAGTLTDLIDGEDWLFPYLEGSWEAPGNTQVFYHSEQSGSNASGYVVCVSQEESGGDISYVCSGPSIGQDGFPKNRQIEVSASGCENCCGICQTYDNEDDAFDDGCVGCIAAPEE